MLRLEDNPERLTQALQELLNCYLDLPLRAEAPPGHPTALQAAIQNDEYRQNLQALLNDLARTLIATDGSVRAQQALTDSLAVTVILLTVLISTHVPGLDPVVPTVNFARALIEQRTTLRPVPDRLHRHLLHLESSVGTVDAPGTARALRRIYAIERSIGSGFFRALRGQPDR